MSDEQKPTQPVEELRQRKIRSFVKREGRMTKGQSRAMEQYWPTMGLTHEQGLIDLAEVFGREAPVVLEIGFGMGKSLVEMAKAEPEKNFIGIEVHGPGVGACLMYAEELGVTNLRLYQHDAVEILADCISDASLDRVQLYFPDPWHKKRHHKRRIVKEEFIASVRQKLKMGGLYHMATDWEHYAEHMVEEMNAAAGFENTATEGNFVPRPDFRPLTKFEARGHRLGHGVWDLIYRRVN
ncbi:tRNA (guanosine(46)-N7)-methyltransferase TrmB [Ferrimonas balearica]|uniref:tRNA (guanosine(46)-N7)-methyltransferase TrmB n=1 Tax=Ferrimonas balearica TaxID=44012 RepID=UPI001C55C062|nr:tRNA (guanosine(46)-N7)-methyltransferase TrmB [Ferrimonas balearica]MBW3139849.1 tRNA (guanosine(46)-N7)-methyltransferase TrmB [Ferrimonas balearica]